MKRWIVTISTLGLLLAASAASAAAPGDYNGDGLVDDADKAIILALAANGSAAGDADFLPAADHDGDGTISMVDVAEFSKLLKNQ